MADDITFETLGSEKYETDNGKSWQFSSMKTDKFSYFFLNAQGENNRKGLTIRNKADIPALITLLQRMEKQLNT